MTPRGWLVKNVNNLTIRSSAGLYPLALFAILAAAIFFGLAIAFLPYWIVVALLILPGMFVLAVAKPLWACLSLLVFASGVIPHQFTPSLPFLGGTIQAADLFLGVLFATSLLRALWENSGLAFLRSEIFKPVYFLAVLVVVSVALAATVFSNQPKYIAYEFRVCLYWGFALILAKAVSSANEVKSAANFIVGLSLVMSLMVIFQAVTGVQVISAARVELLDNAGDVARDVTRSTFGGYQNFVVFSFAYILARISVGKIHNLIAIPLVIVFAVALLVTFGRGVWLGTVLVVVVLALRLGLERFARIFVVGSIVAAAVAAGAINFSPRVADAIESRVLSVDRDFSKGESWRWRETENEFAWGKIASYPISGIGLGGEYQPIRNRFMSPEQTRMIHNSYLYLLLKFGVLGLVFPLWLTVQVWKYSSRTAGKDGFSEMDVLAVALGSSFLITVATGVTQPEWMEHKGVLFMGFVIAMLAAIRRVEGGAKS